VVVGAAVSEAAAKNVTCGADTLLLAHEPASVPQNAITQREGSSATTRYRNRLICGDTMTRKWRAYGSGARLPVLAFHRHIACETQPGASTRTGASPTSTDR
jgi:hypothetical protein